MTTFYEEIKRAENDGWWKGFKDAIWLLLLGFFSCLMLYLFVQIAVALLA